MEGKKMVVVVVAMANLFPRVIRSQDVQVSGETCIWRGESKAPSLLAINNFLKKNVQMDRKREEGVKAAAALRLSSSSSSSSVQEQEK